MPDTQIDSLHFYLFVAVIQGFILGGIILYRKAFRYPHFFLGLWIILISLAMLHAVLEESIHALNSKFLFPMEFGFALAPLGYLHLKSIVEVDFKFKSNYWLHFVPSLLFNVFLFTFFFRYASTHMDWAYRHIIEIQLVALWFGVIELIQIGIYFYFSFRMLIKFRRSYKEFYQLIKNWFYAFGILWTLNWIFLAISIPLAIVNIAIFDENSHMIYGPLGIFGTVFIYVLGYLYLLKFLPLIHIQHQKLSRLKYSQKEIVEMGKELLKRLKEESWYKDDTLTVEKLANLMEWPVRKMSSVIRQSTGSNFNDMINHQRIEAFKVLIKQPGNEKYTLVGLAQEVGFRSKASFYRAFKRECGLTPVEFLNSQEKQ